MASLISIVTHYLGFVYVYLGGLTFSGFDFLWRFQLLALKKVFLDLLISCLYVYKKFLHAVDVTEI